MTRRSLAAATYTLFVVALLLTWPKWTTPPQVDGLTVITGTRSARWLLIVFPFLWGWVAIYSEDKWRKRGLTASVLLLVGCLLFIWYHDNVLSYDPCLWHDISCGSRWFR
jgi:hypothetical protein